MVKKITNVNNIYINRQLEETDLQAIAGGTYVYTSEEEDPNTIDNEEIKNAPIGSIYISGKGRKIYKKDILKNRKSTLGWISVLNIGPEAKDYESGDGIQITTDTETAKTHINAKADQGITITPTGISANVDGKSINIKESKITAEADVALWNVNKLQGKAVSNAIPNLGAILTWNGKQCGNEPNQTRHIYGR